MLISVYLTGGGLDQEEYIATYLEDCARIAKSIDRKNIFEMCSIIKDIRSQGGRLFILGVGGSAANASHAVNDFRKLANIESYTPIDNVSELTARVNDDGWETVFSNWLKGSKLNSKDGVLVFSVGGGHEEKNISVNLIHALKYAKSRHAKILGIVGRDGGYTAKVADACVVVPPLNNDTVTAHTESFQAVIWHLLVSSPGIKEVEMKWESTK